MSRRINSAAVSARKTTVLETSRRKTRMSEARRDDPAAPGLPGTSSPPQPCSVGGGGPCPINASDKRRQRKAGLQQSPLQHVHRMDLRHVPRNRDFRNEHVAGPLQHLLFTERQRLLQVN